MKRKPFPVTTLGEMRFAVSPQERVDANAGIIAAAIVGAARSEIYARSTADCRAVEVAGIVQPRERRGAKRRAAHVEGQADHRVELRRRTGRTGRRNDALEFCEVAAQPVFGGLLVDPQTLDDMARIKTPTHLSLEESLEFLNDDEYCEITPEYVRLRKQILDTNAREKAAKRRKSALRDK